MKELPISIYHVCAYYPPHIGGMERVVAELAVRLARHGNPVTVLTSSVGSGKTADDAAIPGLCVRRLCGFEFAHTPIMPTLLWNLLAAPRRSIFHLHLAQAYAPECVWLAAKIRAIPYVVHYHLDVERSGRLGFAFDWWKRLIQPRIMQDASAIITLTPLQRELVIERYRIAPERVASISNGIDERFFEIGRARNGYQTPSRLLYVGRLTIQKRADRLIDALRYIRSDVQLAIVGDGEDRSALELRAKSNGLANIAFRGVLHGSDLLAAYRDADIFVIASDKEGMPLSVLEAMAAGLPVIGSDVLGLSELIKDAGILVPEPSGESFARAIDEALTAPARLQALSSMSRAKVAHLSWDQTARDVRALYRRILV